MIRGWELVKGENANQGYTRFWEEQESGEDNAKQVKKEGKAKPTAP